MENSQPHPEARLSLANTDHRDRLSGVASLAQAAVDHLLQQHAAGYADAAHRVSFPRRKGFTADHPLQCGDVFVRAIIAEALCDARDAGFHDPSASLGLECDYLLERRRRDGIGGWSYFPDLPELPSDIDDLSQIMQVLARCGRTDDLTAYAEPPLQVVLRDNVRADGAV